jgi:hypothetical protein
MAAEAMHKADSHVISAIDDALEPDVRKRLEALVDEKVHDRQSRLSGCASHSPALLAPVWLRLSKRSR